MTKRKKIYFILLSLVTIIIIIYSMYSNDQNVDISHHGVTIFIKPRCGFCIAAKKILQSKNIPYDSSIIDLKVHNALYRKTGQMTVPYIFINSKFIGGYNELVQLQKDSQLDTLSNKCVSNHLDIK